MRGRGRPAIPVGQHLLHDELVAGRDEAGQVLAESFHAGVAGEALARLVERREVARQIGGRESMLCSRSEPYR